jgi:photosystem II PsbU protein
MSADGVSRRDVLAGAAAAAVTALPLAASAEIEYPNVPYLGGSDKIDVNNANVRAYTKFPGMYPTIAGLIAKVAPVSCTHLLILAPPSPQQVAPSPTLRCSCAT